MDLAGLALVSALTTLPGTPASAEPLPAQITVLYDAFGKTSTMTKDWGFSAFVEHGGKRILFDTGNNAEIFAHNVKAKNIDLTKLDFVVVSHRHGDHTSGLNYLMTVNPDVPIYAPKENFGVFGAALPGTFFKRDQSLPAEMRYFDGNPPEKLRFGSAWPQGKFTWVTETTEVAPGFHLIILKGSWGVDLDVMEISLAIDTPDGIVLIVGCSHPTIEKIVETAKSVTGKPIHLVVGGTHLLAGEARADHRDRDHPARRAEGGMAGTRALHRRARVRDPQGELRRPLSLRRSGLDAGGRSQGYHQGRSRPVAHVRHGQGGYAELPEVGAAGNPFARRHALG